MSKNSDVGLITLIICIIILPIVLIYLLIKYLVKSSRNVNFVRTTKGGVYNCGIGAIYKYKTKTELIKEAEAKYEKMRQTKKKEALHLRLKSLNTRRLFVVISSSIIASLFLVLFFIYYNVFFIIISIIFFIFTIIFDIFFRKAVKKKSEKAHTIEQIINELKIIYKNLTEARVFQFKDRIKEYSSVYKKSIQLNKQYKFNSNICRCHQYKFECNSKRQLDNFNYEQFMLKEIKLKQDFFDKFEDAYKLDLKNYDKYCEQYKKITYTPYFDIEKTNIDYETFIEVETRLYRENKIRPIEKPSVIIDISYTSPTGRNYYEDRRVYSYQELIELIEQSREMILTKPKTLNKRVLQFEREKIKFEQEKQEFLEVTKGHIYSSENVAKHEVKKNIEPETLSQKLKQLRNLFDSGEIDYEEYQKRRKELM